MSVARLQEACVENKADSFDPIFIRIAERLWRYVSALRPTYDPSLSAELKAIYSRDDAVEVNYDLYAVPFACDYLLANYWKAASACIVASPLPAHRVTDAGCGAGATALAYLAYLSSALRNGRWRVELNLIDRSATQLKLAEDLFAAVEHDFSNLDLSLQFQQLDLRSWNDSPFLCESILLGHVLTENPQSIRTILHNGARASRPDGNILVVERPDDKVNNAISSAISEPVPQFSLSTGRVVVPTSFASQTYRRVLEAQYTSLQVPHHSKLATLLATYFRAWRSKNPDLLDQVFDNNAEYLDKPFSRPLQGLDEIKAYWRRVVLPQEDPEIVIHSVTYSHVEAVAEWTASHGASHRRQTIKGALMLKTAPGAQKAHHLREYFRTND